MYDTLEVDIKYPSLTLLLLKLVRDHYVVYMHMALLAPSNVKDRLVSQIIDDLKTIISHSH